MREIKFRAWNTNTKTMVDLKKITPLALSDGVEGGLYLPLELKHLIFIRFTGLKDKNGKEIYFDSDIVEYTYTSDCGGQYEEEFTVIGIVVLDLKHTNSICVLEKSDGKTGGLYHFTAGEVRNIEIIGNIHENPELLEEKK